MIPTNLSFPLKFPACNDAGAWFIFKQLYCLTVGLTGTRCRDLKTWELKTTKHNHCGLLSCAENVTLHAFPLNSRLSTATIFQKASQLLQESVQESACKNLFARINFCKNLQECPSDSTISVREKSRSPQNLVQA